ELNQLQEQVDKSNQSIASSEAAFMAARALVRQARSQLFPTATTNPSITRQRQSANLKGFVIPGGAGGTGAGGTGSSGVASTFTEYALPFDATWVPDLWGKVRNTIN